MTIKERIIEMTRENPLIEYTVKQISARLEIKHIFSINRSLKQLIEEGILTKKPDPGFPKRMLYRANDYTTTTPRLHHDYTNYRCVLLYINTLLKNTIKERHYSPELAELDSAIQKFLNVGGKELLKSVPDEVVKKIDTIIDEQILPLLRSPILETTDAPAVETPALDPPMKEEPETELVVVTPEHKFSTGKKLAKAFPKGVPGAEKAPECSTTSKTTSYKKARAKDIKQKEILIEETPFERHIRYYMLAPEERNYLFAQAWYKTVMRFFPAYRLTPAWRKALSSLSNFRTAKEFRLSMRNARIEADLQHARYEDYMTGICEYYLTVRNPGSGHDMTPAPKDLAGEVHVAVAKDYIEQTLKGKILITKDDIRNSGHVDFILDYDNATPEQQKLASIFYHDILLVEFERAAFLSSHRLFDLVTYAITYGLMPQSWAEGFKLEQLKGYRFPGPVDPPGALFRHIQE